MAWRGGASQVPTCMGKARADLLKHSRSKILWQMVQSLEKEKADLDEMRKALVATLSGATHGHCCLLVPAQQVPAHAPIYSNLVCCRGFAHMVPLVHD